MDTKDFEGTYYINGDLNNPVIISRLSGNQYRVESTLQWEGVGSFDGQTYMGTFRYKDTIYDKRFLNVAGVHRGEVQNDRSIRIHGKNLVNLDGEFSYILIKNNSGFGYTEKQSSELNRVIKILFLAANPTDTTRLRLDKESRAIDHALRQSEFRDKFQIQQHWAVQVVDLQGYLLRYQPDIVHFSGHGNEESEIILENSEGRQYSVSPRSLSQLFSVLKDNIRCVVLNACYSECQAQAIAEHIECVVGMSKAIGDNSAISFSKAFYQALGFGRNIKTAFDLGCVQIDLESLDDQDIPRLLSLRHEPNTIRFV